MIQVFDPGSGSQIWILTFYLSQIRILDPRSRIQGSKRHRIPDPGSRMRICNIGDFGFAQAVGGSVGYWLSTGAAVLTTHSIDQLLEAFMCKKEFSVYFIFTLSLSFLPFLSYDALRICFLTHLVREMDSYMSVGLQYTYFSGFESRHLSKIDHTSKKQRKQERYVSELRTMYTRVKITIGKINFQNIITNIVSAWRTLRVGGIKFQTKNLC